MAWVLYPTLPFELCVLIDRTLKKKNQDEHFNYHYPLLHQMKFALSPEKDGSSVLQYADFIYRKDKQIYQSMWYGSIDSLLNWGKEKQVLIHSFTKRIKRYNFRSLTCEY